MLFNLIALAFFVFIFALLALNLTLAVTSTISDSRARSRQEQTSRAYLASGFVPRNVEEIALLEHRHLLGWTSDSIECFLSPYDPQPHDLDGLAALVPA